MAFIVIGLLLIAAKLAGLGPVADWSWWWILWPFPAAAAWWAFADGSGLTQQRAMQKMEDRKRERREKAMAALGLGAQAPARSRPASSASTAPRPATEEPRPGARNDVGDVTPPRRDPRL